MSTAEDIWRNKTDEDVLQAARRLDEYTEEGQRIILAELARRRDSISQTQSLYNTAARRLDEGVGSWEVESTLIGEGVDPDTAAEIVRRVGSRSTTDAVGKEASRLHRGLGWIVVGGLVTFLTYSFAPMTGGYLLAWGPVVYGIIEVVRGLRESR